MQRRIRRAFTSIKEHTCVSYAKIATIGGFCDIDHIIVKATAPDDFPLPDKYVHDLLKIFSLSPSSYPAFALGFAHRFRRTRSWRVALKCLLLLHRLLQATPNDSPFRAELLWARTNNVLCLYPCNFQDSSSSTPDEYTHFVRSYARLLDEALDCVSFELVQPQLTPDNADYSIFEPLDNEEENSTPLKIKDLEGEIEILPQLQSLIDRAVDCWPAGAASRSFLVHAAMKHVIRDSFACYAVFRGEITAILDNLIQLPYRSCVAAFAIYKKAALQADQLSGFHQWCKSMGYCGSYEYPIIDRVPDIQIRALESFLDGMWQLTDQSSSNVSTETSDEQSPSSTTDNDGEKQAKEEMMKSDKMVKKEMEVEMGPLIEWEVESWEDLLEASVGTASLMASRSKEEEYGLQMQVYNPCVLQTQNPFCQQQFRTNFCHNDPVVLQHPWGL